MPDAPSAPPLPSALAARGLRVPTRGVVLFAISLITPAGLVAVNLAAYVMANLAAFRLATTVSAVISTFVLNGLTMGAIYRFGTQNWPDRGPFRPGRRRGLVAAGGFVLCFVTVLAGVLTYSGLSEKRLPNLLAFMAGVVGLAFPLALAAMLREARPRSRRRYRTR